MSSTKPLEPPDSHFLSAASGWIELGDCREAGAELDRITPALRAHPDVLKVRYEIHAKTANWNAAAEAARALLEMEPEDSQFWILHAYAMRRMDGGGIPKAREILKMAQMLFPRNPLICYNIACYECQSGSLAKAQVWLKRAFRNGNAAEFRAMALKDPDLQPLWAKLSAANWKQMD